MIKNILVIFLATHSFFSITQSFAGMADAIAEVMKTTVVSGNKMGVSSPETFGIENKITGEMLVYDIGCGAGYFTDRAVQKGAYVVAVDADFKGIEALKTKSLLSSRVDILQGFFPNQFRQADLGKVDLIYSSYMLQLVPIESVYGIFQRIFELLKPNGIAYIIVPDLFFRLIENQGASHIANFESLFHLLKENKEVQVVDQSWTRTSNFTAGLLISLQAELLEMGISQDVIQYSIDRSQLLPEKVN